MVIPTPIRKRDKIRPILLAAIQAKATHLLTGDVRYFGKLFGQKVEGILILPPGEYPLPGPPPRGEGGFAPSMWEG